MGGLCRNKQHAVMSVKTNRTYIISDDIVQSMLIRKYDGKNFSCVVPLVLELLL